MRRSLFCLLFHFFFHFLHVSVFVFDSFTSWVVLESRRSVRVVAQARDGTLYYTHWYTNMSLSRLYFTVTKGAQIFQVMGPGAHL